MTLTAMALGRMTLMKQAALVLGGTGVLALASQVSVPFYPVPMTLQTLAVLSIGFAFGSRLGAITVLAWLAQAAMGAPVLSNFGNAATFFGPTAGFLVGFVGMAFLAGLASEKGLFKMAGMGLLASALLYVPGLAWPLGVAEAMGLQVWGQDLAFGALLDAFAMPFLLGDAVKAVLAAALVSGGLSVLRKRG
ncbi:biotin transport system substrate-specific component [Jannaschia faecimaris]|uniref:Biotin transporter n=1 Tax=Jannaschia faecimaris TaxID=1244108 RepID=A0A1H3S1I6_9RHOB|nr:biotin transporter BioY [Jannaschia faecimaris]SDZ31415.1 biotin transport system substrate-specific component [Jannaschia faecimaris]